MWFRKSKVVHGNGNGATPETLVARFFHEVLNQRNAATADEIVAADFVAHHPSVPGGKLEGPAGVLAMVDMFRASFPDLRYTIQETVREGTRIAVRWAAIGTNTAPFSGVSRPGRTVTITGIDVFRIEGRMLAESWVSSDLFGLFMQLGAFPPIPGPPTGR